MMVLNHNEASVIVQNAAVTAVQTGRLLKISFHSYHSLFTAVIIDPMLIENILFIFVKIAR